MTPPDASPRTHDASKDGEKNEAPIDLETRAAGLRQVLTQQSAAIAAINDSMQSLNEALCQGARMLAVCRTANKRTLQ